MLAGTVYKQLSETNFNSVIREVLAVASASLFLFFFVFSSSFNLLRRLPFPHAALRQNARTLKRSFIRTEKKKFKETTRSPCQVKSTIECFFNPSSRLNGGKFNCALMPSGCRRGKKNAEVEANLYKTKVCSLSPWGMGKSVCFFFS